MNRDRLTRTHPGELGFLEICGYPELVLGQRHEALCGLHTLTELRASIADNSVSRSDDACIAEVQSRLIEVGLSLLYLRFFGSDGALCTCGRGLIAIDRRILGACGRIVLVKFRLGNNLLLDQLRIALRISLREVILCLVLANRRHRRNILLPSRIEICFGLRELRARLLQGYLVIAGIELDEKLARFNRLIVVDVDRIDRPVDPRADGIEVSIDLCIVGVLIRLQISPELQSADT